MSKRQHTITNSNSCSAIDRLSMQLSTSTQSNTPSTTHRDSTAADMGPKDHRRSAETIRSKSNEEEEDDDWIQLIFDNSTFTTTRSTLLNDKDSMLAVMFQKNSPFKKFNRDLNHPMRPYVVIMDRNPQYFEPVLNYLRSGEVVINPNVNTKGVLLEARYWGVSGLVDELEKIMEQERLEKKAATNMEHPQSELTRQDIVKALITCPSGKGGMLRFQGLNLTGIDLSGLDLSAVDFSKSNLRRANLSNCCLEYAEMRDCILEECNFSNSKMYKVIVKNSNCKSVVFSGCMLRGSTMTHCDMQGADFKSSDLEAADLSNSILKNADLSGASMKGVVLRNCLMTNVVHTSSMGGVLH